ncbi:YcgN family cysteine cluster protein [Henriciella sp.]|uniref:YcgN family cysteine cluster protein n=1 Tax=Henriciella sp. TaxID=1968823 RepID=UPI0017E45516|nr:YcgN family cysteine cluster protein [Henriciella sp.]HIG23899.1 YcgN family cysteine cluster protein [Henriciella sp.]
MSKPFWETKSLTEMTPQEWESLCDGCAKCCLIKLEDEDSGDVAYTRLHCKLLDADLCRCADYPNRKAKVPDCVILTPKSVSELKWMPKSCAYRRVHEGRGLEDWHHLVCGDRQRIHEVGKSIMGQTVSEETVFEEDQIDWIIDWDGNPPD